MAVVQRNRAIDSPVGKIIDTAAEGRDGLNLPAVHMNGEHKVFLAGKHYFKRGISPFMDTEQSSVCIHLGFGGNSLEPDHCYPILREFELETLAVAGFKTIRFLVKIMSALRQIGMGKVDKFPLAIVIVTLGIGSIEGSAIEPTIIQRF
jgi:hypothetical protein